MQKRLTVVWRIAWGVSALLWPVSPAPAERPVPSGQSAVTISYQTASGAVSFSGNRGYLDEANLGPSDATILGGAPNIAAFNSVNSFGRRTALANSNPNFANVLGPNESLVTHAFFKNVPAGGLVEPFFPGLVENGDLTITVENIQFAQPVTVDQSTFMMHVLWNADQVDRLVPFYTNVHNHHTETNHFRDFDDFLNGGIFNDSPSNTALGAVTAQFTGSGTDTLGFSITVPYTILRNLEDIGQSVPAGLPAPQGFLEPFHFHFEYIVTPEPTSLMLVLAATLFARRRVPFERVY